MSVQHHILAFDRPLVAVQRTHNAARAHTAAELVAARTKGYHEGEAAARAFSDQQVVDLRAEVSSLQEGVFGCLERTQEDLCAQVKSALPLLTIELGARLLAGFEPPPELVERICRDALETLYPERTGLELVVGTRDVEILENLVPGWETHFPKLRMTVDDTLVPGDCMVRSRFGVTDARGSEKLEGLRRELVSA